MGNDMGSIQSLLVGATAANLNQMFEDLKDETGLFHVDVILERFLALEAKNFSLFNYIHNVGEDVENIETMIEQFKKDIAHLKHLRIGSREEDPRQHIVDELKRDYEIAKRQSERWVACCDDCGVFWGCFGSSKRRLVCLIHAVSYKICWSLNSCYPALTRWPNRWQVLG